MSENLAKVCIKAIKGQNGKFSEGAVSEAIRKAFIEANGGETSVSPRKFRPGTALYDLVEEIIPVAINTGVKSDNALTRLIAYKNIADGDKNVFRTKGKCNFIVRDTAAGIQGVRRQRIEDGETVSVKTTVKYIRVYDDINRFMSGNIDFSELVAGVARSFSRQMVEDAVVCLENVTTASAGLNSTYVIGGTFSEDKLSELIEHVEAESGVKATIIGTKTALRQIKTASFSDEALSDLYNLGYCGHFYGNEMLAVPQAHKADGKTFVFDNKKIYVVASSDKPIKVVNEGEGILVTRDATDNADLTQEYFYAQPYGVAFIASEKMGIYTIS